MKVNKSDDTVKIRVFEISETYNYSTHRCRLTRYGPFSHKEIIDNNSMEELIDKAIETYCIKEFELIPTHYENDTQEYTMICKCDIR